MEGVSDIAAQDNKSVAVSKTGCVYVWGYHVWQIVWKPVKTEYSNIHDIFKYRIPYIIQDNKKKILTILECLGPSFNDIVRFIFYLISSCLCKINQDFKRKRRKKEVTVSMNININI